MKYHLVMIASLIFPFGGGSSIINAEESPALKPHPFGKREHVVQQMNGEYEPASLPAEIQWISKPWYRALDDENAQMPYLAYLAEKDRVVMLAVTHHRSGKGTWLSRNHSGLPVVSLDDIRRELDVVPTDNQGEVVQLARERW